MRYSKSMYRGGFLVDAEQCDYNSSRDLGLICPFCSQAVFLRRGTSYERNGRQVAISAAFAHYKNDDPVSEACELRATRKDGEDYLRSLAIASKNQRLELYNKRLWNVIKEEFTITSFKIIDKNFGKKWLEVNFKACKTELRTRLDFYIVEARQLWYEKITGGHLNYNNQTIKKMASIVCENKQEVEELFYLNSFDKQLQPIIFEEVIRFLSTNTGGYALNNLLKFAVMKGCANVWTIRTDGKPVAGIIPFVAKEVKQLKPEDFVKTVVLVAVSTKWVRLFDSLEKNPTINPD